MDNVRTFIAGVLTLIALAAFNGQALCDQNANADGTGLVYATAADLAKYPMLVARSVDTDQPDQFVMTQYLPPVANQGDTSSCVGWSTAYYCMTYTVARHFDLTPDQIASPKFEFSPNFIWDQFNSGDPTSGMHIFDAFNTLSQEGCCSMQEMPWDPTGAAQAGDAVKARALKFKARSTVNLFGGAAGTFDTDKLKTVLWETKEPVVIGIDVFDDFFNVPHDPGFVYTPDAGAQVRGGHAICIVGYDNSKQAFRMVNSWGTDWADKGFLWLSQAYVRDYTHEAWAQDPGGPRSRDPEQNVEKLLGYKDLYLAPPTTESHLKAR